MGRGGWGGWRWWWWWWWRGWKEKSGAPKSDVGSKEKMRIRPSSPPQAQTSPRRTWACWKEGLYSRIIWLKKQRLRNPCVATRNGSCMWATPFFHGSQVRVSSPPQQNLCRPRVCLRSEVVLHDDGSGRRAGTESPIVARPQSPHPLLRRTHALQHPASSEGRPLGRRRANWRRDADRAGPSRCRLTLTRTLHLALMLASSPRRAGDSDGGVARARIEQGN